MGLRFEDDIPPVYPTSPGPVPITLAMERLVLKRGDDGVFHLGAPAHDRPLTDVPEKLRLPKEQVLLVPLGQGLGCQEKESPTLQQELMDTKQALAIANQDKEKLLQEVRKYNPLFEL